MEQNSPFYGTTEILVPLATSSSLYEQVVIKEQFCTDTIKLATPRTETSSTYGGNKKEKMTLFVCPFKCGDEPKTLKCHIQLQHSERIPTEEISGSDENTITSLLCPFECGVEPFKTQNDQREHLMKEHSCTDNLKQLTPTAQSSSTNDGNRKGHVPHLNDFFDERETEEKNNIRKTCLSNTQGLTLYKFRKLLRENNLHEVLVHGNRYCFLSCIIITLAEHGINKTLEVLSTEVMATIMENKDNFYSSFKNVSKLEDEKDNLIECCARYFQGAPYNNDSVDVCVAAIVKTLGVNLNLFHYDCYVNTQYYKQNAVAISSRMVKTTEEEEAEKALKTPNEGNTAATLSTIVQPVMEPRRRKLRHHHRNKTKVTLLVQ